ncbi:MAG: hypothetical protein AAF348_19445, partial [Bacteroidota bacterium]
MKKSILKKVCLLIFISLNLLSCKLAFDVETKYLQIMDYPKDIYKNAELNKLNAEEIKRAIERHYVGQEKDITYNNFIKSYNKIKTEHNALISDIAIKIKKE